MRYPDGGDGPALTSGRELNEFQTPPRSRGSVFCLALGRVVVTDASV
jgi:hypothetical protein